MKIVPKAAVDDPPSIVTLSAETCSSLCAGIGFQYLTGYEGRVLEYTLSEEIIDRDGDIIKVNGIDTKNFLSNPVVLFIHNGRTYNIGMVIKLWEDQTAKKLKGWVLFLDARVDTSGESERCFRYCSSRAMRAGSIGFRYIEWKSPSTEERTALGMHPYQGIVIEKCELLEFSVCPVPANPSALNEALKKGLITQEDFDSALLEMPMTRKEVQDMIAAGIASATKGGTETPPPEEPEEEEIDPTFIQNHTDRQERIKSLLGGQQK